jgi:hypothetical protein
MDPAVAALEFAKAGAILADILSCCRHPGVSA